MTSETIASSPPKCSPAINTLRFLDELLKMGEEPDEISYYVGQSSEKCAGEFFVWLTSRGIQCPKELLKLLLLDLFQFTYLLHWSTRASIRKLSKAKLNDFLLPMRTEELENQDLLPSPNALIVMFFRYLSESGYDVDFDRAARAISKKRVNSPRVIKTYRP